LQTKNNTQGYAEHKIENGPKANEPRNLKTKMGYRKKKKLSPTWAQKQLFYQLSLPEMNYFTSNKYVT